MITLHAVADDLRRTVCGVKLGRGVHRTGRRWVAEHCDRRPVVEPCPDCLAAGGDV